MPNGFCSRSSSGLQTLPFMSRVRQLTSFPPHTGLLTLSYCSRRPRMPRESTFHEYRVFSKKSFGPILFDVLGHYRNGESDTDDLPWKDMLPLVEGWEQRMSHLVKPCTNKNWLIDWFLFIHRAFLFSSDPRDFFNFIFPTSTVSRARSSHWERTFLH